MTLPVFKRPYDLFSHLAKAANIVTMPNVQNVRLHPPQHYDPPTVVFESDTYVRILTKVAKAENVPLQTAPDGFFMVRGTQIVKAHNIYKQWIEAAVSAITPTASAATQNKDEYLVHITDSRVITSLIFRVLTPKAAIQP
jgi:hypothetical protein